MTITSLLRIKALSLLSLSRHKGFLLNVTSVFLRFAGYHRRTSCVCHSDCNVNVSRYNTDLLKHAFKSEFSLI